MNDLKSAETWTAERLDEAIKQLAEIRATKEPPIPTKFACGGPYNTVDPVLWNTQREVLEGESLIHFRHPGFGWLHFTLSPEDAKQLAGHLLQQVKITEQQMGETKQ